MSNKRNQFTGSLYITNNNNNQCEHIELSNVVFDSVSNRYQIEKQLPNIKYLYELIDHYNASADCNKIIMNAIMETLLKYNWLHNGCKIYYKKEDKVDFDDNEFKREIENTIIILLTTMTFKARSKIVFPSNYTWMDEYNTNRYLDLTTQQPKRQVLKRKRKCIDLTKIKDDPEDNKKQKSSSSSSSSSNKIVTIKTSDDLSKLLQSKNSNISDEDEDEDEDSDSEDNDIFKNKCNISDEEEEEEEEDEE